MNTNTHGRTIYDAERLRDMCWHSIANHVERVGYQDATSLDNKFLDAMQVLHATACRQIESILDASEGSWVKHDTLIACIRHLQSVVDDPDQAAGVAMQWIDRFTYILDRKDGDT